MSRREMTESDLVIDMTEVVRLQRAVAADSHQTANMMPWMTEAELKNLVWDITANGYDKGKPVRRAAGKIWDGRNRELAVRYINKHEELRAVAEDRAPKLVSAKYEDRDEMDPMDMLRGVVSAGLIGRKLSSAQIACLMVKSGTVADMVVRLKADPAAVERAREYRGEIKMLIAAQSGTNGQYIHYAERLLAEARPDLMDKVINLEIGLTEAIEAMRIDKPKPAPADTGTGKDAGDKDEDADDPDLTPVLDAFGTPVPDRFRAAFSARPEIEAMLDTVKGVRDTFRSICQAKGGVVLEEDHKEITAFLKKFSDAVKAGTPHCVCPHCKGEGRDPKHDAKKKRACPVCSGVKFATKARYDLFEAHGVPEPEAEEAAA